MVFLGLGCEDSTESGVRVIRGGSIGTQGMELFMHTPSNIDGSNAHPARITELGGVPVNHGLDSKRFFSVAGGTWFEEGKWLEEGKRTVFSKDELPHIYQRTTERDGGLLCRLGSSESIHRAGLMGF